MNDAAATATGNKATRKEIFAWALYDWANSAYTTLSITALVYYITHVVLPGTSPTAQRMSAQAAAWGHQVDPDLWGDAVWGFGLAVSMLTAALLSPVVGAMADVRATKRIWLGVTALSGAVCPIVMFWLPADWVWTNIALFVVASMLFDLSFGFYNGFLPELSDERTVNRISAWGFALGYLGGAIPLAAMMLLFKFGHHVGLTDDVQKLRTGLLLMGLWWGGFTIPTVWILRDKSPPTGADKSFWQVGREAFSQVATTLSNLRRYRMLVLFLLGFLFYNDGIQTVISQSSVFATKELHFDDSELFPLILTFQFICLIGALIDSVLTDRIGQKPALMIYLAVWLAMLGLAYFVTEKWHFWALSVGLGLVMGGAQTVSRSIMSMMTPPRHTAEFFGFFNFSGRATSWLGNAMFAWVGLQTGSKRLAIVSLIVFFVIGWLLVLPVNVRRGREEAQRTGT